MEKGENPMKKAKLAKAIFGILIILGLVLVIGAAGGIDKGFRSFGLLAVGIILSLVSAIGLNIADNWHRYYLKREHRDVH